MSKLSKREKVMLYVLGLILLVVIGVWLLILPMQDATSLLSEHLESVSVEMDQMQYGLATREGILQVTNEQRAEYAELASRFMQAMPNDHLDQQLSATIKGCGLTVSSISISNSASSKEDEGAALLTVEKKVGLGVKGPLEGYIRLLEKWEDDTAIQIDKFDVRLDQETGEATITMDVCVQMLSAE